MRHAGRPPGQEGATPVGGRHWSRVLTPWAIALGAVVLANVFFLAFNILGSTLPTAGVNARVRAAFQQGQLEFRDWRPYDRGLGFNQYNDCSILMMGLGRDGEPLQRAVGPRLLLRTERWSGFCETLHEVVHGDPVVASYPAVAYTRYWHGYVPLTMTMLQLFSVENLRRVLKLFVAGSLLLLMAAGWRRSPELRLLATSIAAVGLAFWALPYYGQSPSHSPGDAFVMLGLCCLLFWPERLTRSHLFVPFCALYGAGVTYLEFLTGQLPIAAGLLLPIAYYTALTQPGSGQAQGHSWRFATAGLLAFGLGAALTLLLKQAFVLAAFGSEGWQSFVSTLARWTGVSSADVRYPPPEDRVMTPLIALLKSSRWLAYGSRSAAMLLLGSAAAAWLVAAWLAARRLDPRALSDFLAFVAGALVIPAWVFVLPTHTVEHAAWMVRILIVPISLGWAALFVQLQLRTGRRTRVSLS